ncbi:hypothetical protein N7468_001996, partial [Penicillium chermesinum]
AQLLTPSAFQPRQDDSNPESTDRQGEGTPVRTKTRNEVFSGSAWDALKVRHILRRKVGKGLPNELVDKIMDAAEYWASEMAYMAVMPERSRQGNRVIVRQDHDMVVLKTVPLCFTKQGNDNASGLTPLPYRGTHPCRKIIFHLSSHDQGGGGDATGPELYQKESWTWFDTEVIHAAHKRGAAEWLENEKGLVAHQIGPGAGPFILDQTGYRSIGGNVEIVWHYLDDIEPDSEEAGIIERTKGRGRETLDGRGVRELQVGDAIAVWARARFPNWTNIVYNASAQVFWAV